MLIAAGTLAEFLKFLQIFLWITIPSLICAVIITTLVHYRAKRKKASPVVEIEPDILFSFNTVKDIPGIPGEYALKASIDQLKNFRKKFYFSNARYSVLKKDLERLEKKYNALLETSETETSNRLPMEQSAGSSELQFQLDRLTETATTEKQQLLGHLDLMNQRFTELESENRALKQQATAFSKGIDEDSFIRHLQKDNAELKQKIAELKYAEDLIEEKDAHIGFLQEQIEKRVRTYHQLEQQFTDSSTENLLLKNQIAETNSAINNLKEEILERDRQDHQVQELLEAKNATIAMLTEDIQHKRDRLLYLENSLNEMRLRNEELQHVTIDKDQVIRDLHQQIEAVEQKFTRLAEKLDQNRRFIAKMQGEMNSVLEEVKPSPVIVMNTEYVLGNGDEVVASSQSL